MQKDSVLAPGTRIRTLTVEKQIGSGAFSTVYRCATSLDPEYVALKVIPKTLIRDGNDAKHLQTELDTTAFLRHPNICRLLDFFSDDSFHYLVLDYCAGGDIADYVSVHGAFRDPEAAFIFYQVVSALQFCHAQKVAHRDLKLQNILITSFPYVKLTDFGLAGHFAVDGMHTFCGSPAYSAPECLSLIEYDGELADCWSLGVILYELVTGRSPWPITNLAKTIVQVKSCQFKIPSGVSPSCADLIGRLLRLRPDERLRCEEILVHGWMKAHSTRVGRLPAARAASGKGVSLLEVTDAIGRDPAAGIVSPFDRPSSSPSTILGVAPHKPKILVPVVGSSNRLFERRPTFPNVIPKR
jgi:serine/threonine protein kinase